MGDEGTSRDEQSPPPTRWVTQVLSGSRHSMCKGPEAGGRWCGRGAKTRALIVKGGWQERQPEARQWQLPQTWQEFGLTSQSSGKWGRDTPTVPVSPASVALASAPAAFLCLQQGISWLPHLSLFILGLLNPERPTPAASFPPCQDPGSRVPSGIHSSAISSVTPDGLTLVSVTRPLLRIPMAPIPALSPCTQRLS